MGCTLKKQECALCGTALSPSGRYEIDVHDGDTPGRVHVCKKCREKLSVIKPGEDIRSYTGNYSIRLSKDGKSYEMIVLEGH
jgi:hypothetical protein